MAEMDEYQRQELEERIKQAELNDAALRVKYYRDNMKAQEQVTARAFERAMKKAGITTAEFQRLAAENPTETMERFQHRIKQYVRDVAAHKTRHREPSARPISTRSPTRTESRSRSGDYEELKQRAQRGQVADDELVAYLSKLL